MEWRNVLKDRTRENIIAQIIVGFVLMLGYSAVVEIQQRREHARLIKKYATSDLNQEV